MGSTVAYYRLAAACAGRGAARPVRAARAAGRAIGNRLVTERRQVRANLARVLPGASAAALDRAVSETFANFAACFADLLTINRGDPARLRDYVAETEGEEDLDAACAPGRGVILLTAHVGNWDLGGRLLAPRLDRTTHVVLAGGGAALEDTSGATSRGCASDAAAPDVHSASWPR